MKQEQLKEKILNVIEGNKIGVLATVENNKPYARYMTFLREELTFYTPTNKKTEKVDEIKKNPYVHVLFGYEDKGLGDSYIEVAGTAKIMDTKELKQKFWETGFQHWFDGPDDPNYVLLQIKPESIRLMNNNGEEPQELDF